jgi:FkbM family methyltransferase
VRAPIGFKLFRKILKATDSAREDKRGWVVWFVRQSVVHGVHLLKRFRAVEFPQRATGGWWWEWRWKFEFLMSWYEWQSLAWVRRIIRPGMTVVDLGAHVGYYSRLLSKIVGPKGKVFAFEPNLENLELLRRNLAAARCSNVEILPYAVSNRSGRSKLFISPGHSNHSLMPSFTAAEQEIEVETVSLDAFLQQRGIPSVDFIKIDIEGSETLALSGMKETIRRSSQICALIEFNPLALRASGTTPARFLDLLRELELEASAILDDAGLGPLPDISKIDMYTNLLCRKPGDRRFGSSV